MDQQIWFLQPKAIGISCKFLSFSKYLNSHLFQKILPFFIIFICCDYQMISAKSKRKYGAAKGAWHSFRERSEDHDKFSLPDLEDDNKSNSGSSVSR